MLWNGSIGPKKADGSEQKDWGDSVSAFPPSPSLSPLGEVACPRGRPAVSAPRKRVGSQLALLVNPPAGERNTLPRPKEKSTAGGRILETRDGQLL